MDFNALNNITALYYHIQQIAPIFIEGNHGEGVKLMSLHYHVNLLAK